MYICIYINEIYFIGEKYIDSKLVILHHVSKKT